VENEGRFWRNLYLGRQRLNPVQIVGISIFVLSFVAIGVSLFLSARLPDTLSHRLEHVGMACNIVDACPGIAWWFPISLQNQ